MHESASYYHILGLSPTATADEIKKAYRRLALKYHPDVSSETPDSQARFVLITDAYEILSDQQKRQEYDGYLRSSQAKATTPSAGLNRATTPEPARENKAIFESRLNTILWDIEDVLAGAGLSRTEHDCLMIILTFIDKWVLEPAGFPDYFMQARQADRLDPRHYISLLRNQGAISRHLPFANIADYYYDVRKRSNRWLDEFTHLDLFAPIPNYPVRRIDALVELQKLAYHYLRSLKEWRADHQAPVHVYQPSRQCYEWDYQLF